MIDTMKKGHRKNVIAKGGQNQRELVCLYIHTIHIRNYQFSTHTCTYLVALNLALSIARTGAAGPKRVHSGA